MKSRSVCKASDNATRTLGGMCRKGNGKWSYRKVTCGGSTNGPTGRINKIPPLTGSSLQAGGSTSAMYSSMLIYVQHLPGIVR
jgi:hypothetical protein